MISKYLLRLCSIMIKTSFVLQALWFRVLLCWIIEYHNHNLKSMWSLCLLFTVEKCEKHYIPALFLHTWKEFRFWLSRGIFRTKKYCSLSLYMCSRIFVLQRKIDYSLKMRIVNKRCRNISQLFFRGLGPLISMTEVS